MRTRLYWFKMMYEIIVKKGTPRIREKHGKIIVEQGHLEKRFCTTVERAGERYNELAQEIMTDYKSFNGSVNIHFNGYEPLEKIKQPAQIFTK